MLRQNRYQDGQFICAEQALTIDQDEILISAEHAIVIALEPEQVEGIAGLMTFIRQIIKAVPALDNEVQDFYETISHDTDFPHSLSIIYFDGNDVILDYWSDEMNNQFSVIFTHENEAWWLKEWNGRTVPDTWHISHKQ